MRRKGHSQAGPHVLELTLPGRTTLRAPRGSQEPSGSCGSLWPVAESGHRVPREVDKAPRGSHRGRKGPGRSPTTFHVCVHCPVPCADAIRNERGPPEERPSRCGSALTLVLWSEAKAARPQPQSQALWFQGPSASSFESPRKLLCVGGRGGGGRHCLQDDCTFLYLDPVQGCRRALEDSPPMLGLRWRQS